MAGYDDWKTTPPDECEDEATCDRCGRPAPRLTPPAVDLCDDCWRAEEQLERRIETVRRAL